MIFTDNEFNLNPNIEKTFNFIRGEISMSKNVIKTDEYTCRISPDEFQKAKIEQSFAFEESIYNQLAEIINERFNKGAGLDEMNDAINNFFIKASGERLQFIYHVKNEMRRQVKKLLNGDFTKIFFRGKWSSPRRCYFKNISLTDTSVIAGSIGEIHRRTHSDFPADATIIGGEIIYKTYENFYEAKISYTYIREIPQLVPIRYSAAIGLDYTQNELYRDSNNNTPVIPEYIDRAGERIKELEQELAHTPINDVNWIKLKRRIEREKRHLEIRRNNWQHETAKNLVDNYDLIAVETLDFKAMKKARPELAAKINRNQYPKLIRILEDYAEQQGKQVVKIDKYYPSTQICSACGERADKLPLEERIFRCPKCGTQMQRDLNAAKNIRDKGLRQIEEAA